MELGVIPYFFAFLSFLRFHISAHHDPDLDRH